MTHSSLGNPYDGDVDLRHGAGCGCERCHGSGVSALAHPTAGVPTDAQGMLERAVESAVVRSVFGHDDLSRRQFAKLVGGG